MRNVLTITKLIRWWQKDVPNSRHRMTFDNLLNIFSAFCASVIVELLGAEIPDCPGLLNN